MTKSEIRTGAIQLRDALSEERRAQSSRSICEAVADEGLFLDARAVHVYKPIGSEVDITPLMELSWELGKDLGMMVVDGSGGSTQWKIDPETTFESGPHGIRQPVNADPFDMDRCDLVIVPLVAGDSMCNRIGYGKGYYDQFLSQFPRPTIGVAFDVQIVESVPTEPGDIELDMIVTESGRYSLESG